MAGGHAYSPRSSLAIPSPTEVDRVYFSSDRQFARAYGYRNEILLLNGNRIRRGALYRVQPVMPIEEDPDFEGTGVSWCAPSATVLEIVEQKVSMRAADAVEAIGKYSTWDDGRPMYLLDGRLAVTWQMEACGVTQQRLERTRSTPRPGRPHWRHPRRSSCSPDATRSTPVHASCPHCGGRDARVEPRGGSSQRRSATLQPSESVHRGRGKVVAARSARRPHSTASTETTSAPVSSSTFRLRLHLGRPATARCRRGATQARRYRRPRPTGLRPRRPSTRRPFRTCAPDTRRRRHTRSAT